MDKDYYKEHRKNSFDNWAYSARRMDLLIVSICGGGIYIVLETLKYSMEKGLSYPCSLKLCGGIFVMALIVNFISQWTGLVSNSNEMKFADEKLDDKEDAAKVFSAIADKYGNITSWLNLISMVFMFSGIVLLVSYFFFTF